MVDGAIVQKPITNAVRRIVRRSTKLGDWPGATLSVRGFGADDPKLIHRRLHPDMKRSIEKLANGAVGELSWVRDTSDFVRTLYCLYLDDFENAGHWFFANVPDDEEAVDRFIRKAFGIWLELFMTLRCQKPMTAYRNYAESWHPLDGKKH